MGFINSLFGGEAEAGDGNFATSYAPQDLDAVRQQQQAFTNALQTQAAGGGLSVATAMLNNNAQTISNNASAMAAGARGVNPGLALKNATQVGTDATQQAASQGVAARMQEQMNAQQQLGGQLNTMMGQGLQAQQQKDIVNSGVASGNADRSSKTAGGLVNSAMGAAAMLSDERAKTDVKDGTGDAQAMLDSISAKTYEYKDPAQPGAGEGQHTSPMAQDLEKTPMGASMVQDTPDGKVVDYGKGFGALMAGMAALNKRFDALEGKKSADEPQKMAAGGQVQQDAIPGLQKVDLASKNPDPKASPEQDKMAQQGMAKVGGGLIDSLSAMFGPDQAAGAASGMGGGMGGASMMAAMSKGGAVEVPGKAKVRGDSTQNDTVKALLSPGEVVIPRSVMNSKDPAAAAAKFVAAIAAKSGEGMKSKPKSKGKK